MTEYQPLRDPGLVATAVMAVMIVLAFLWLVLKATEPKYRSVEDMIREDGRRRGWITESTTEATTGPGESGASTTTPHEEA